MENQLIFDKYLTGKIVRKDKIFYYLEGLCKQTNELVSIKAEPKKSDKNNKSYLELEAYILHLINNIGIPKIYSLGKFKGFLIMVQEILGFNLKQIKNLINSFNKKDIAIMGIQMMNRIELIHSNNYIHCNIRPENYTTGYEEISRIYLINYEFSRKYRNSLTGKHIKYNRNDKMKDSTKYDSFYASKGVQQSRRDDMISIGYMLIDLFTGKLPWKDFSLKDKYRQKKYLEMLSLKSKTPADIVCKNMPKEFIHIVIN